MVGKKSESLLIRKYAENLLRQRKNTLMHQMTKLAEAKGRQIRAYKEYKQAQEAQQVEKAQQEYAQMEQAAALAEQLTTQVTQTRQECRLLEQELLQAAQVWRHSLVGHSSSMWETTIIPWLSRFFSKGVREEWLGEIYEMHRAWQKQGLAPSSINIKTLKVALLFLRHQLHC